MNKTSEDDIANHLNTAFIEEERDSDDMVTFYYTDNISLSSSLNESDVDEFLQIIEEIPLGYSSDVNLSLDNYDHGYYGHRINS